MILIIFFTLCNSALGQQLSTNGCTCTNICSNSNTFWPNVYNWCFVNKSICSKAAGSNYDKCTPGKIYPNVISTDRFSGFTIAYGWTWDILFASTPAVVSLYKDVAYAADPLFMTKATTLAQGVSFNIPLDTPTSSKYYFEIKTDFATVESVRFRIVKSDLAITSMGTYDIVKQTQTVTLRWSYTGFLSSTSVSLHVSQYPPNSPTKNSRCVNLTGSLRL